MQVHSVSATALLVYMFSLKKLLNSYNTLVLL